MASPASRALRIVLRALLAACALKVWHLLILRLELERPGVFAAWLVALLLIWAATVRPARSTFLAGVSFLILVFAFHWGYERAASDGREYFVQVRSLVFDRDLNFTNESADFASRGTARIYPFGAALMWAPFMVLAHVWLKLLNMFGGAYATDGYTFPYQMAVGFGSLVYGFAGLVLIWRMAREYFGDPIAAIATIAATAGSFFFWYLTVENSMVHGASMFATTLFVYIWHRGRSIVPDPYGTQDDTRFSVGWWVALGFSGALTTMVRWQNITFVALGVLIVLWQLRRQIDRSLIRCLAGGAAGFIIGFLPQLIFWKVVRGGWFDIPTADHSFDIRSFHAWDVLFSSNHGLFATTPIAYIALLGVPAFVKRDRALALLLIGGFISQVIVNAGPEGWWGGSGYGARRFDNSMIVFVVGLAALLVWLKKRPLVAPITALAVLIAVNLIVMADVRNRRLPMGEAITFADVMSSVSDRVGNIFSFPYNLWVAWRFDTDYLFYDRLKGRSFNNLEIDLGDESDGLLLGGGWHNREHNDTRTFRWSHGPASSVIVPLRAGDKYRIEIVCEPFSFPDSPPQILHVEVNRREVAVLSLTAGMQTYRIDLANGVFHPNLNLIQFKYAYSKSPAQLGLSKDERSLAVLFDSLKLRRLMDD